MDARRGLAALLGRAHPLRGPAARVAIARATIDGAPAVNARDGPGRRDCPRPCPRRRRRPAGRRRRTGGDGPITPGHQPEAQSRAVRADRPPIPDQPRHRPAALRRPAADRGRGAGQDLGRRGRVDAGQGPLASRPQHRLRLHPPRRRRPGLQQGHHDRAEHELLLRRCRPVGERPGDHPHDRCHLPAPGGPAGPELPALGHPDGEERRPAPDRRRLLHGAPVPGDVCRRALHGRAGARRGRADRHPEPRPGPRRSRSTGPGTCSPTSSSRPSRRGSSGASRAPGSRRCSGSTPARWSSRWSTTTSRSP